jgi:ParB family chromosome partitioning protein
MKTTTTAAPTFRQLIDTKMLKRADAMKARIQDIFEEPGFNLRLEGPDLEASIDALAAFIADGGQIPDLEVRPRDGGGVFIVDGHRRRRAILRAMEQGADLKDFKDKEGTVWVSIKAFNGSEAERVTRVMTSADGRPLGPLEIAHGYQRLAEMGLGPEQISKHVHKTRQHVDQMLILANAPADVRQLVATGAVSATTAVQVTRKEGEGAGAVLAEAAAAAKAKGKGKVTGAEMKPWAPPAKRMPDLVDALDEMERTLPAKTRQQLVHLEQTKQLDGQHLVSIDAGTLWQLLQLQEEMQLLREKK